MKNILLIVGGTGFIGLSLLNYLNKKKNNKFKKIITISTSNSKWEILKKFHNIKLQHISKKIIKLKSLPECDNIIYLALSKNTQDDVKNFEYFINLLEKSKFKGKILYTSSGAVNKYLENKKNKKFNHKDYAIAKIKNENLLRKITSKNIKSSIARCYTFVGKFIPLNVSAPFHSNLMRDSAKIFSEKINNILFKKINIDLISNHKLINYKNISEKEYNDQLSLQIHSPVMWSETIKTILSKEINTFIEIGPKKTLINFLPKDFQGDKYSLRSIEDINFV